MPVTVVIGGQFGSEGKGKTSLVLARDMAAEAVVRIGGPNSGHTVVVPGGQTVALRQLPVNAVDPDGGLCVIGAGSYLDIPRLLEEVRLCALDPSRLLIDRNAMVLEDVDRDTEMDAGMRDEIGSTCSGTGAALMRRVQRESNVRLAHDLPHLRLFVGDADVVLRRLLDAGSRVIVEGTQGFGLSLLHGDYPYVTSRDTTASAALAEAGLSPLDVDDIVLVLRAHPIRVAGNSGPFHAQELTWDQVAAEGGHQHLAEYTTVTKNLRRVARFDASLVRRAIAVNQPTRIAMNHLDYLDATCDGRVTPPIQRFIDRVESLIERRIDLAGLGPTALVNLSAQRR